MATLEFFNNNKEENDFFDEDKHKYQQEKMVKLLIKTCHDEKWNEKE
jgi:hypothetical protein